MERELTEEAQADRDDFDAELKHQGCFCCVSPPCSWCLHPGNPRNQEDDSCYKSVEPEIDIMQATREICK